MTLRNPLWRQQQNAALWVPAHPSRRWTVIPFQNVPAPTRTAWSQYAGRIGRLWAERWTNPDGGVVYRPIWL
jgi:hypothetical protein